VKETVSPSSKVSRRVVGARFAVFMGVPFGATTEGDYGHVLYNDPYINILAGLTFQTDQSFGALASRMVDHGLIRRTPGEGRAILHRLTPAGEAMLRDGHVVVNEVLAESLAPLTASERQQLHGLLNRLLDEPAR
jgi:DNA-binding MarR family transcriptional regulator